MRVGDGRVWLAREWRAGGAAWGSSLEEVGQGSLCDGAAAIAGIVVAVGTAAAVGAVCGHGGASAVEEFVESVVGFRRGQLVDREIVDCFLRWVQGGKSPSLAQVLLATSVGRKTAVISARDGVKMGVWRGVRFEGGN